MSGGKRPIGAAKGKQPDTEALCQTPPALPRNFPRRNDPRATPPPPLVYGNCTNAAVATSVRRITHDRVRLGLRQSCAGRGCLPLSSMCAGSRCGGAARRVGAGARPTRCGRYTVPAAHKMLQQLDFNAYRLMPMHWKTAYELLEMSQFFLVMSARHNPPGDHHLTDQVWLLRDRAPEVPRLTPEASWAASLGQEGGTPGWIAVWCWRRLRGLFLRTAGGDSLCALSNSRNSSGPC